MKTFLLSLLLVCNLMAYTAEQYAPTIHALTDLDNAYTKAKNENKAMIFLLVVKGGCHWCEKMVEKTLQDKAVKNALSDAVTVITDLDSTFSRQFKAEQTPSMYFIDAKTKKVMYEQVGYEKPGAFMITVISAQEALD